MKVRTYYPRLSKYLGRIETLQFFRIMSVIAKDLYSMLIYVILVAMGIVYFILMNKVLWGSRWGPRV